MHSVESLPGIHDMSFKAVVFNNYDPMDAYEMCKVPFTSVSVV